MKKIISLFVLLSLVFCLFACNGGIKTYVSDSKPADKKIIEVEAEDFGEYAYFTTKTELTDLKVNRMVYDGEKGEYSVEKTVFTKETFLPDECLKIVLDLQQKIPYIMVEYTLKDEVIKQYIYKDFEQNKMYLLEQGFEN